MNSQTIQWSSEEAKAAEFYLLQRSLGNNQIKSLATLYGLDERLYHSSMYLLDYLFIKHKYTKDIKLTAKICLVLVTKFYDNGVRGYQLESDLFADRKDSYYKEEEVEILKAINYDLFFVTPYDSLSFLLNNGIIFEEEKKVPLEKIYFSCLLQLNMLVEKSLFIKFTPFQLAFSIISLTRYITGLNPRNEFLEELYGYDIEHYVECYNSLKSKIKINQGRRASGHKKNCNENQRSLIRKESMQKNQIEKIGIVQ